MKIDIHTHTKKCKSGDAPTREIAPSVFRDALLSTDVGIVAVTNHNVFDLNQFEEILTAIDNEIQVWPGIELDVLEDGSRGHLLVIVPPAKVVEFSEIVANATEGSSPDDFTTTVDEVLHNFDTLEPLYVAHYKQKTPSISEEGLEKLASGTSNPVRVIKEVTNSISAGIYISHGHPSVYGSDVQNWSTYEDIARDLPDLRLPVESFEHFCLLLEKDPTTINTALNNKVAEHLVLNPFPDGSFLKITVFNDINVVFGPKGTGKSCILKAIAKHYSEAGTDAAVYESGRKSLSDVFDIAGRTFSLNLDSYDINYCKDEIESLRDAIEEDVSPISKYLNHFRSKTTNKNARRIKLKNIEPEEPGDLRRDFRQFDEGVQEARRFFTFLDKHPSVRKVMSEEELGTLQDAVASLVEKLGEKQWESFSGWKEIVLLNSAIERFRVEIERKTGSPAKPSTPGFKEYALNRVRIAACASEIIKSMKTAIPMQKEAIGSLGPNKGNLERRTELVFQNGSITDTSFKKHKNTKKGAQKQFARKVSDIFNRAFGDDLFEHVAELNEIEDVDNIETVYELLLIKRYFALDNSQYDPSSGESSMILLQKELEADKEVYILDEPEKSLGNEYINDVIVPLIKDRARAGKKVFISTHDANIAVRTLPYSSVYRRHGPEGYETFIGNPFSNDLVSPQDEYDVLDWKETSMRTLEGGVEAFGERGKIYGNT